MSHFQWLLEPCEAWKHRFSKPQGHQITSRTAPERSNRPSPARPSCHRPPRSSCRPSCRRCLPTTEPKPIAFWRRKRPETMLCT